MTEGLRFSVIIPTFQRRDTVLASVQVLALQSFGRGFEVIVVVDGSDDGSTQFGSTSTYATSPAGVTLRMRADAAASGTCRREMASGRYRTAGASGRRSPSRYG